MTTTIYVPCDTTALSLGATLRKVMEDFGGGTFTGRPMDDEAFAKLGAGIDHGGVVAFDDTVDMGERARFAIAVLWAKRSTRMLPGVVYTTFHHPGSGANMITTDNSHRATNRPEYKVTAVQVEKVSQPSEWQRNFVDFDPRQQALLTPAMKRTDGDHANALK